MSDHTSQSATVAVAVEQCDRDLLATVGGYTGLQRKAILSGEWDDTHNLALIARHRLRTPTGGERARVVLAKIMNRHASRVLFHDKALAEEAWSALSTSPSAESGQ